MEEPRPFVANSFRTLRRWRSLPLRVAQQTKGVISNFSSKNIIDQNATHLSHIEQSLRQYLIK